MHRKPAERVMHELRVRDLLTLADEICSRRGVALVELCGRERTRSVSWARQELWWRMRRHPERHYSLLEIARLFGRDHSTIKSGIDAYARRAAQHPPSRFRIASCP